jgi:FkbM family methyltransferase
LSLISYAQNQEDVMLWRALGDVEGGFYVDVGAADPSYLSVTRLFYEQGWHGINLEPDETYFAALLRDRPRDINLCLCASRTPGPRTFHAIVDTGLSTLDDAIARANAAAGWKVQERIVDSRPLTDILREHRREGPIHFLKIDVEGAEAEVLAGLDLAQFRPWIVLLEATLPNSRVPSHAEWEPLLLGANYRFAWFDGLNRFYLAGEMAERLAPHFDLPPNIFDGFLPPASLLERTEAAERRAAAAEQHAEQRAAAAEQRAAAAEQRTAAAEQRAAAAEQRTAAAEQRAAAAEQRTAAAEQRAEQRATAAEQRATAAEQRAAAAEQRADDLRVQRDEARHEVQLMHDSTSWRLTAPVRWVGRLARRRPKD